MAQNLIWERVTEDTSVIRLGNGIALVRTHTGGGHYILSVTQTICTSIDMAHLDDHARQIAAQYHEDRNATNRCN